LFISVKRPRVNEWSKMVAYDPWAQNGDTVTILQDRWNTTGQRLYRERMTKDVQWTGSPRGERYGKH
jgi:hypothetical protein